MVKRRKLKKWQTEIESCEIFWCAQQSNKSHNHRNENQDTKRMDDQQSCKTYKVIQRKASRTYLEWQLGLGKARREGHLWCGIEIEQELQELKEQKALSYKSWVSTQPGYIQKGLKVMAGRKFAPEDTQLLTWIKIRKKDLEWIHGTTLHYHRPRPRPRPTMLAAAQH